MNDKTKPHSSGDIPLKSKFKKVYKKVDNEHLTNNQIGKKDLKEKIIGSSGALNFVNFYSNDMEKERKGTYF